MKQKIKINKTFGSNLKKLRTENGYTQEQLVTKLQLLNQDISRSAYARSAYAQIECGTYNIKIDELVALQKIYNVSYDVFFESLTIEIN